MMDTSRGKFEWHTARELIVHRPIQRKTVTAAHLKRLRDNWDPRKVGVLLCARLQDGDRKGQIHVYAGGTRHATMMEVNPDFVFACLVTDMTEQQAAAAFMAEQDSKKPGAFDNYRVGVREGRPEWLAVKQALDFHKLMPDPGNASYEQFTAFAAAKRIVEDAHGRSDDWQQAGESFTWVLGLTRRIYRDGTAHDADMIQAISKVALWNVGFEGDESRENELVLVIGRQTVADWRKRTQAAQNRERYTYGGSESRASMMATVLIAEYNRGKRGKARLMTPDKLREQRLRERERAVAKHEKEKAAA